MALVAWRPRTRLVRTAVLALRLLRLLRLCVLALAYDDFWPYAYDDVYYGIYGPYAYYGPYGSSGGGGRGESYGRHGRGSGRYAARGNGSARRAAEVCSDQAPELTDWPIERIAEVVQPNDAQRAALEELRAASAQAIEMLKSSCPEDLPSISAGRLGAMESWLQVMLAAVQTVRPALERFYQSLSDEQKARFNAIALPDDPDAAENDRRHLTTFCDQKAPRATDLPIDRIAHVVQPTPPQQAALAELKDASVKAAEGLESGCPTYETLTPYGSSRGNGEAPGRDASRRQDHGARARAILQCAKRRTKGAPQFDAFGFPAAGVKSQRAWFVVVALRDVKS